MLGIMVASILAATMSSVDTTFNWLAAVVTKDAFVPLSKRFRRREPSERIQLAFGKSTVAILGVIAIWIALNIGKYGGAFDVYLRADSLYKPSMFVPIILGLVFTRTPWWSGMLAFGGGVVAIIIVDIIANISQGMPADSFGAIFTPITVNVLGLEMGRYEINTLTGISVSGILFLLSAFFNKREGAFAQSISSLERDLKTPAHATTSKIDLSGIRAYLLAGRLAMVIGGLLLLLAIPTMSSGGAGLNVVAGLFAIALGAGVVYFTKRVQQRYEVEPNAK